MNKTVLLRGVILAVLIGIIAIAAQYRASLNADTLSALLESYGIWAPVIFIALFAIATVAFLPGVVFALAGGVMFGPVLGTIYNLTGATIGAVLAFMAARYLASDWVRQKTGPRLDRIIRGVEDEGWRFVAFTRLVPLFPFNLLNYALGLTRIPFWHYTVATAICMIPGSLAFTYLGHAGREAAAGSEGAIRNGLIGLGLLAVVMFIPRLIKKMKGVKNKITTTDLKQRIDGEISTLVLDVREQADFDAGHILGARLMPLGDIPNKLDDLDAWRDRPIAVICRTNNRSGKAAKLLEAEGFSQILLVDDGMVGWSANGFKTE